MNKKEKTGKKVQNAVGKTGLNVKIPDRIQIEVPKKIPFNGFLGFILAITLLIFGVSVYAYNSIPKSASSIGNTLGTLTGKAVGSLRAFGEAEEAAKEGKEKGISAEDTKTMIDGFMQNCGQLQVMRADMKFVNLNNNADNYITLMQKTGDAVFIVDLAQASYNQETETLIIPNIDIRLDLEDSSEKLAEYEKSFFSGDAEDGVIGTLNTEVKTTEQALLELQQDTDLMKQIREKSKEQVAFMLYSLLGKDIKVQGTWEIESGE